MLFSQLIIIQQNVNLLCKYLQSPAQWRNHRVEAFSFRMVSALLLAGLGTQELFLLFVGSAATDEVVVVGVGRNLNLKLSSSISY